MNLELHFRWEAYNTEYQIFFQPLPLKSEYKASLAYIISAYVKGNEVPGNESCY
jgi:hypothetical protein